MNVISALPFGVYNPVDQGIITQKEYCNLLYRIVAGRFIWETPENVKNHIPQMILSRFGKMAITSAGCYPCEYIGTPDQNGTYKNVSVMYFNGGGAEFIDGENCIVVHNTMADIIDDNVIARYAYLLAQTDITIDTNMLYSRASKIFRANTNKEKLAIEDALNNVRKGYPAVTLSDAPTTADFLDEKTDVYTMYDVTNPNIADTIQYLDMHHDTLIRRFCAEYGIDTKNINKQAQVTTAELNQFNEFSNGLLLLSYSAINDGLTQARDLLNVNYSIKINPVYLTETETKEESETNENAEDNDTGNIEE